LQYDPDTKYNSPLIIVRKKNNGIRLVNNYIELNKKTITDRYPMANANELLSRAAGSKFVSILDLFHYFWQIPLSPESRKYTGFHTPFGSYSYVMTPMGLSGAPMTAQRLIDRVLKGAHKYGSALMDDIVIHSGSWDDHLKHVRDVLERLRSAGLTANIKKCVFASNNVRILGHVIRDGKIYCDDDEIKAVQK